MLTTKSLSKIFYQPADDTMLVSGQAKLYHKVREPTHLVDIVPNIKRNCLVTGVKFTETGCAPLLTWKELLIYDGNDLKITNKVTVLVGSKEPGPNSMWHIPL